MAGETDPGKETPPTCRAEVGWSCAARACGPCLLHLLFLLGPLHTTFLCSLGFCCNGAVLGMAISSKCLPGLHIDGKFLEMGLQAVLEPFIAPDPAFPMSQFSVEELFFGCSRLTCGRRVLPISVMTWHLTNFAGESKVKDN